MRCVDFGDRAQPPAHPRRAGVVVTIEAGRLATAQTLTVSTQEDLSLARADRSEASWAVIVGIGRALDHAAAVEGEAAPPAQSLEPVQARDDVGDVEDGRDAGRLHDGYSRRSHK